MGQRETRCSSDPANPTGGISGPEEELAASYVLGPDVLANPRGTLHSPEGQHGFRGDENTRCHILIRTPAEMSAVAAAPDSLYA